MLSIAKSLNERMSARARRQEAIRVASERLMEEAKKRLNTTGRAAVLKKIEEAIELATKSHKKQYRYNGDPYITHPLQVALMLLRLKINDPALIVAAVLHDAVEDHPKTTLEDIRKRFGERVSGIVRVMTKQDMEGNAIPLRVYAERIRNASEEVRLIKAVDALHNSISTLERMEEGNINQKELEKVKFYYHNYILPMAERLSHYGKEIEKISKVAEEL